MRQVNYIALTLSLAISQYREKIPPARRRGMWGWGERAAGAERAKLGRVRRKRCGVSYGLWAVDSGVRWQLRANFALRLLWRCSASALAS